jgi:hypothetical protein
MHDAFTLVDVVPPSALDDKDRITCLTYQGALERRQRPRRQVRSSGGGRRLQLSLTTCASAAPATPTLHRSPTAGDVVYIGTASGRIHAFRVATTTSASTGRVRVCAGGGLLAE